MNERLEAIKGNIIYAETPGELTVMPDSWIVTEGGIIRRIAAASGRPFSRSSGIIKNSPCFRVISSISQLPVGL